MHCWEVARIYPALFSFYSFYAAFCHMPGSVWRNVHWRSVMEVNQTALLQQTVFCSLKALTSGAHRAALLLLAMVIANCWSLLDLIASGAPVKVSKGQHASEFWVFPKALYYENVKMPLSTMSAESLFLNLLSQHDNQARSRSMYQLAGTLGFHSALAVSLTI